MKYLRFVPIVLILVSCKNNKHFPDYPVFLEFNITANAPELAALNGFKEFTKQTNANQRLGLGGILVFHSIDDKFYAFDMACTNKQKADAKVRCDNLGIVVCDSCKTQFYVGDGTGYVQNGVAKYPLKKYSVYYDASLQNIIITN